MASVSQAEYRTANRSQLGASGEKKLCSLKRMPFKIRHSTLMMIYLIKLIESHQVRIISCSLALNNLPF